MAGEEAGAAGAAGAGRGARQTLNDEQQAAAEHGDGPLLIIAGAGTGKTMTLAHRVAHLIEGGVEPGRILLVTFTRRAAAEMLGRVDGILRGLGRRPARERLWGGTFHATAARLVRLHGRAIGLDPAFTILDRTDAEDLMDLMRTDLGFTDRERRFPQKGTCMDIYCRCVDTRAGLPEVLLTAFPWCKDWAEELAALFSAYTDHKERHGVLDYDDLLVFWHALLADEAVGPRIRERFDHVLVDEYQDTNALQADILETLRPGGTGLTVVGDDAQAIYGFRAATVRNILDFPKRFEGTTVVTLTRNYRSVQPVLDAANRVIALAPERYPKELLAARGVSGAAPVLALCEDEDAQTEFVVEGILARREEGLELKRQAVLFRASHHSMALEFELTRRNIPYHKYGGLKFGETAHVKDLMAFLRLAENPRDVVAATRLLKLLPGVGPKTARGLADALAGAGGDLAVWSDARVPPAADGQWPAFLEVLTLLMRADPPEQPASQVGAARAFLSPIVAHRYDDGHARLADLEQLEWLASRYRDRAQLLAEIALDPPSWAAEETAPPILDEDYLILSTMHSAKGLEWDAVYVIHAADGNIPSDMSCGSAEEIEEERRLFYVALTRAKDWLTVCAPSRYYKRPLNDHADPWGYARLTRFLPDAVRGSFDEWAVGGTEWTGAADGADVRGIRATADGGSGPGATVTTTADVRAALKRAWA